MPATATYDTFEGQLAAQSVMKGHGQYYDQPANDFSSLSAWLTSPRGYLQGIERAFAYATGKSFYERLFPDEYVDVSWSGNAVHWLSRVPCAIVDHLCYWRGRPGLDHPFHVQAAEDWRAFFEHRAQELRVGGHLVVVVVRLDHEGSSGGDHFVDADQRGTRRPPLSRQSAAARVRSNVYR